MYPVLGIERIELGIPLVLHFLDVFAEGGDGHGDAIDQSHVDQGDEFGGAVADDEVLRIDVQHVGEMFLAHQRVARRIGLDQIWEVALQIIEHFARGVIRVGDEAEIDDLLGLFVADQIGNRRRMRSLVEEMAPQLGGRVRLNLISK